MRPKAPAPIRVLHAVKSLGLGGTEKAMQLMVTHLDRALFEPFVFSFSTGDRHALLKEARIPVIVGPDLLHVLETLRPQVVHLHRAGWAEGELLAPVLRYRERPVVVETNVFGRFDPTPGGARIDLHLMLSRFCLDRLLAHHGLNLDPAKYRVLYYPVDTDAFAKATPAIDFSRHVAGRLSRSDPGKWSRLVFDMLPLLRELVPSFSFLVVGATPEFEDFVAKQGLAANVELVPPVLRDQELAAFFGRMSLLAHANDTGESFGLAIAEAQAAGLPVVTHPAQGERDNAQLELVEHGVNGLVAATAEDYAKAVYWLWQHPQEARAMGLAGQEKARKSYRAQHIAKTLGEIYLELLGA